MNTNCDTAIGGDSADFDSYETPPTSPTTRSAVLTLNELLSGEEGNADKEESNGKRNKEFEEQEDQGVEEGPKNSTKEVLVRQV